MAMTFTAAVDGFTRDVCLVVNTVQCDSDRLYGWQLRHTALHVTGGPHLIDIRALRECAAVVRFVTIIMGSREPRDVAVRHAAERLDAALQWTR